MTSCGRCGKPCKQGENKNLKAKPFRRAKEGYCPNCAVTQFLLSIETLRDGLVKNGLELLRNPVVQKQFSQLLRIGKSELPAKEINWDIVINQWDLPFPRGSKTS